jgi:hypothetical protein
MWGARLRSVVMGKHSQLGPIDPQLVTPQGNIPARGIIEQFERAKEETSENPALLTPFAADGCGGALGPPVFSVVSGVAWEDQRARARRRCRVSRTVGAPAGGDIPPARNRPQTPVCGRGRRPGRADNSRAKSGLSGWPAAGCLGPFGGRDRRS